jgi:hypothetical protein
MTSKLRVESPEAMCHVMNRGGPERVSPNAFSSSGGLVLVSIVRTLALARTLGGVRVCINQKHCSLF